MAEEETKWTISHQIPLVLIFAIFFQTAGAFWWASRIETTISNLAKELVNHQGLPRHSQQEAQNRIYDNRITKLEILVEHQTKLLEGIRDDLKIYNENLIRNLPLTYPKQEK